MRYNVGIRSIKRRGGNMGREEKSSRYVTDDEIIGNEKQVYTTYAKSLTLITIGRRNVGWRRLRNRRGTQVPGKRDTAVNKTVNEIEGEICNDEGL